MLGAMHRSVVVVAAGSATAVVAYVARAWWRRVALQRSIGRLGKVEFHAHLHGSIRRETLIELAADKGCAEDARALLDGCRELEECFDIFGLIHKCVDSVERVARVCRETLEDFERDGCAYLELRSTPRALGGRSEMEYLEAVVATLASWDDAKLTPRFIVSVDRSRGPEAAIKSLNHVVLLRATDETANTFIVGVDFSGNPTSKHSFEAFETLFRTCRDSWRLKCALHVGEVARGDDDGQRILALAAEDPKKCRLGHALHFTADELLATESLIEVCPSSNLATLRLESLKDHPRLASKYLDMKSPPIAICTDDSGVFGSNLNEEYLKVQAAFDLTVRELALLVDAAAEFAFDAPACRAALRKHRAAVSLAR